MENKEDEEVVGVMDMVDKSKRHTDSGNKKAEDEMEKRAKMFKN